MSAACAEADLRLSEHDQKRDIRESGRDAIRTTPVYSPPLTSPIASSIVIVTATMMFFGAFVFRPQQFNG
jgi:hypothetical protein